MTTAQAVGAVSREAAEWYAIDWQASNRNVRRLQVRIVQATKASRWGRVRALQRLLTHSYSGKVLAVRRVTENNGKKTPGVDQEIWDTPERKIQAVHALKRRGYRSQPLRRVYIPKSDGKTMRPLGIPTMIDRGQQALYLLALAPVVETTADKNSYGFRQQRSCDDAMVQCFLALRSANTQWILEGDIKSCFDKISHEWLLAHVPMDRVILQKWLKSGYMEKHVLHESMDGTPQGGIISPALANCALDGLERLLQGKYPAGKRLKSLGGEKPCVNLVRYADDFVITSKSKELLEGEIKPLVERFLQERGLELSPTKTVITHVEHGFDFLGQNVRRYPNGKLFIKPSKKNVGTFLEGIRRIIKDAQGVSAANLIDQLNPKIRGWANYHRHVVSKHTFGHVDRNICGNGHDEGTRTKVRAGSNRNTLTGAGIVTGPSSVKPAMTKDGRLKSGCTTPRALPLNDTSRLKAKRTRTIPPMKPTSKNAKGLTCWKRFGVPALFAISGMSNVDSARSAIQRSPGSQAGAFITASPV
jgi:RNA-directed DNA polymerase